jgi:hypothetical protein
MARGSSKALTCQWYGEKALVAVEGPKGSKTAGKFAIHCKCVACQRRRLGYATAAEVEAMRARNPNMSVTRNNDNDEAWNALFEVVPEPEVLSLAPTASRISPVIRRPPFRQAKN